MLYVHQNISIHTKHSRYKAHWMKLGLFPLRCCDAHTHAVITHLSTPLFPSQDSGLSSVPLPCAWNKVVVGEDGVFPDLTEVCVGFGFFFNLLSSVGFRLCTSVVFSQLLVKSSYIFHPPYFTFDCSLKEAVVSGVWGKKGIQEVGTCV